MTKYDSKTGSEGVRVIAKNSKKISINSESTKKKLVSINRGQMEYYFIIINSFLFLFLFYFYFMRY